MLIPFIDEINVIDFKQASFFFIAKNRKAMNEIFDSLLHQGRLQKISLKKVFSTTSLAFVIWKSEKSKIIMNLRKINIRLYSNAYSLSRQNIILNALSKIMIFNNVNFIKSFFQQKINSKNWWKIILMIFHREQEWLTISTMNLTNTSNFFQHRMKKLLNSYLWQFVLMYIDDVIIYSQFLNEHFIHLNQALVILKSNEVTLALFKCYFIYSSIKALKHHVSQLRLNTTKKKVEVIKKMKFSRNLKELKVEFEFFNYYRSFVDHYAIIARSLI